MSRCAKDWAWYQRVSPTQKLVLVALTEQMSQEPDSWPGEECLSELTGLPMRAVTKAMRELEAKGLILCLRLKLMKEKKKCCGLSCFVDWSG
jgi:DNA-binding MarR family transcriptional regulator